MTIPVNKVVKVNILTSPTFPARKGFGLLLIIGQSARLPLGQRIRFYSDMDAVAADFSGSDEEYKAANIAFSQSPRPSEIAIGRRYPSGAPGELLGSVSTYTSDIPTWQAITAGKLTIPLDGLNVALTAMDFSAAANLNAVAAVVQAKLTIAAAGATITFDGTRFIVRSATTGASSTVGYSVAPGSGTDIGPLLGLNAAGLGLQSTGVAAESITQSLDALQLFDASWYGFSFTSEVVEQNIKDAAAWAETRVKIFGYTTLASNVQDGAETSANLASFFKNLAYRRTFGVWDKDDSYSAISAMVRAFTVNFNEQNSTITLKFKQLPGTTPETITETQRLAFVAKNINYYTRFGDSAMLAEGVMASGVFFDEVHGLDWLQNAIETNVFGYLYTRTTKVPQTDKGVALIVQKIDKALVQGVNNGLLAPGVWNGGDLGQVSTGDYLPRGFYVYAQPVASQNQGDREARKAPPIQVIAKGAGAIHFVDISLTFER